MAMQNSTTRNHALPPPAKARTSQRDTDSPHGAFPVRAKANNGKNAIQNAAGMSRRRARVAANEDRESGAGFMPAM